MKKKENKRPNDGIKGNLQIKKDGSSHKQHLAKLCNNPLKNWHLKKTQRT